MESQITETGFQKVVKKSDFETAVIIFQDKTPESAKKDFGILEWITVSETASPKSKIKKQAWENIKRLAAGLSFSEAKSIFEDNKSVRINNLMLDMMSLLASSPVEINYCINHLSEDDPATGALLERLSATDGLFIDWTAVFLNSNKFDVRILAFSKAQEAEATFEEWEAFNKEFRKFYDRNYLSEGFAEMRKRADTFRKKLVVYNAFREEKSLIAEILKDMEETADELDTLAWLYERIGSEKIKNEILTVKGSFDHWLYVNQTADKDWLKELSLKRMKESAETFHQKATIWCRDPSEHGKNKAVSDMIKMASTVLEAKLAYHRASGTSLEIKAQQKLKKIVLAL